jgi:hypothetical protein
MQVSMVGAVMALAPTTAICCSTMPASGRRSFVPSSPGFDHRAGRAQRLAAERKQHNVEQQHLICGAVNKAPSTEFPSEIVAEQTCG